MADYSKHHQMPCAVLVNVNSVGDTPINVPFAKFIVTSMKVMNASVDLSASSATLGLYTAAAAGGTAIVTPATGVLTPLSTANKVSNATIASTDVTTGTAVAGTPGQNSLFIRNGVAHGSAATVTVLLEVVRIPN